MDSHGNEAGKRGEFLPKPGQQRSHQKGDLASVVCAAADSGFWGWAVTDGFHRNMRKPKHREPKEAKMRKSSGKKWFCHEVFLSPKALTFPFLQGQQYPYQSTPVLSLTLLSHRILKTYDFLKTLPNGFLLQFWKLTYGISTMSYGVKSINLCSDGLSSGRHILQE